MWLTATGILLGTQINFLEPIAIDSNFNDSVPNSQIKQDYLNYFFLSNYAVNSDRQPVSNEPFSLDLTSITSFQLDKYQNNSRDLNRYYAAEKPSFKSGKTTWRTDTKLGSFTLQGNFDRQAHLEKGKAFWQTNTKLGSVNLAIDINDRFKPLKSSASWETDSPLGYFAIKGKFDRETTFMGGDADWKAKTPLGALSIKGKFDRETTFMGGNAGWRADTSLGSLSLQGNFDRDTVFTGGNIKVATKIFIGSLEADFAIDEETRFKSAKASWDTKFLLGSDLGISGKFDEARSFDGGTIELGRRTSLGNLNLKANLDREIQFTDVSINFKFALP